MPIPSTGIVLSALPTASTLDGTESLPLVQSGVTKKLATSLLATQAELDAVDTAAVKLAGAQTVTGAKTFAGRLISQHSVNGENAVDLQVDNGDGRGQRSRFIIENNPAPPGTVDLDFRDVSIEIGSHDSALSAYAGIRMYQPSGSTGNMLQIFPPGRDPAVTNVPAFYVTPFGAVGLQVGGLAGTALFVKTGGDANSKFEVSETGALSWGAGGATAMDTNLYRSAADTLKTDDSFVVGPYISFTASSGIISTDGRIVFAGVPKWNDAGLSQTTVGAAGGASALPASPTKYLKVDHGGTTYVIPAFAAA